MKKIKILNIKWENISIILLSIISIKRLSLINDMWDIIDTLVLYIFFNISISCLIRVFRLLLKDLSKEL